MSDNNQSVNIKEREQTKIGFISLLGIGIGTTIGAGVVTVTGQAIGVTGRSAWLAYLVAIVWGAITVLPYVFLSSTFIIKGGTYTCVAGNLGPRIGGIYSCMYIPMALNFATFCVGFAQYVRSIFPGANAKVTAVVILLLFYLLNLMGIDIFVKIQNILTASLITMLLIFGFYGITRITPEVFNFSSPEFAINGFSGFIQAVTMFIFSTVAYQILLNFSAEAEDPKKNIPKAQLGTLLVICIVYPLVAIVAGGVLPLEEAANQPLTVIASHMWPTPMVIAFIIFGPLAALVTTLNGNYAGYGRPLLGAAKDGWFPPVMARQNKAGAPYMFLTLGTIIALVPILVGYDISSIIRNMVILFNVNTLFIFLSALAMPKKYPEKWKASKLHLPDGLYYVIMSISGILILASIYLQLRNLNLFVILFTVVLYAIVIIYGNYRYKKGYVKFERDFSLK